MSISAISRNAFLASSTASQSAGTSVRAWAMKSAFVQFVKYESGIESYSFLLNGGDTTHPIHSIYFASQGDGSQRSALSLIARISASVMASASNRMNAPRNVPQDIRIDTLRCDFPVILRIADTQDD
jgi:hypothetical protein